MTTGTDQDKLRVLLPHWIEHNAEHTAEFRTWAEKARAIGQEEVAEEIDLAAKQMGWVNEALSAALDKLGGSA
jgi:nickel/cobalt exporter